MDREKQPTWGRSRYDRVFVAINLLVGSLLVIGFRQSAGLCPIGGGPAGTIRLLHLISWQKAGSLLIIMAGAVCLIVSDFWEAWVGSV